MLIKTFTWLSLTYIVGISSAVALHQVILAPGSPTAFQTDTTEAATITGQIVNRAAKSNRLPIEEMKSLHSDKEPPSLSRQNAPNPQSKSDCKSPIDVVGRCFADARNNQHVT